MRPPTAKALVATTLSALLITLLFVLLCASSSSSSSTHQPLPPYVMRSRRLLSTQCRGTSSCSTPVSGFSRFFKAPSTVFESLKRMPKSSPNPSHNQLGLPVRLAVLWVRQPGFSVTLTLAYFVLCSGSLATSAGPFSSGGQACMYILGDKAGWLNCSSACMYVLKLN